MKVASVGVKIDNNPLKIEEVRGYNDIEWTHTHVVFIMNNRNVVAYRADTVLELSTYDE